MNGIILVWLLFVFWYLCFIIWPKELDECSKKNLEKWEIKKESKLNYIYIYKGAYPKLKIIAYFTILYFILNIVLTIFIVVFYNLGLESRILDIISFIYFILWLFVGVALKLIIMKKN